jgi:hypothetical protein
MEELMLKTEGDTLESYLGKIEYNIRESRPQWDVNRQWKMEISNKVPLYKADRVNYRNMTIYIGMATLECAFNGDREIELETLITYSLLVTRLEPSSSLVQ